MIWLTWRQFRAQAIVASAALAVLAVVLAVTGLHLAHLYDTSGIATCPTRGSCATMAGDFLDQLKGTSNELLFYLGAAVLYAVPVVIGVFWGAPLVTRELEAGTFRLAWNQSVTRTRWLAVKLGAIGLAAMATAGLFSLMITWWGRPVYAAAQRAGTRSISISRFEPALFATRDITPVGYAAFAFALGVAAGVLIRRTLPAMAATLAAFAAVQVAWPSWVRPHLISPLRGTVALNPAAIEGMSVQDNGRMTVTAAVSKPGAWVLSNQTVTAAGHPFTGPAPRACGAGSYQACVASLGRLHLRQLISYQPASRFWDFQRMETGIFLALAVALAGFCFWRLRRRA
jgi:hypothetical protein